VRTVGLRSRGEEGKEKEKEMRWTCAVFYHLRSRCKKSDSAFKHSSLSVSILIGPSISAWQMFVHGCRRVAGPLRSMKLESTRTAAYQAATLQPKLGGKR
jgi:hypothetical protein